MMRAMVAGKKKLKNPSDYFEPLFALVAEKGWEGYSLPHMAEDLGLSRKDFYLLFPSKQAILASFTKHITEQIIEDFEPSPTERESLFDLLMLRFEVMKPYKSGLALLYNETVGHATPTAPMMLPELKQAAEWMVGIAASDTAPYLIHFRAEKLLYVYLMTYKVWIRDQSEDLDLTLVELDRRLDQVASFQGLFKSFMSSFQGMANCRPPWRHNDDKQ